MHTYVTLEPQCSTIVRNGSYRGSLAGIDLNRSYIDSSRKLHPTIFYVKQMIKRVNSDCDVITTVDLHGHSRKMNVFVYVIFTL